MEKDHPSITISEEDEFLRESLEPDDQVPEEKKSVWRKIAIIILIILLLLLLFWPVSAGQRRRLGQREKRRLKEAARVVGATKYTIVSGKSMPELQTTPRKAIPVGVWFEAENLSNQPEMLDYTMVKLVDSGGNAYPVSSELTERWYEQSGTRLPWGEAVGAGRKVRAIGLFYVFRGPVKNYSLRGRDFDPRSNSFNDFAVGAFDTMGR